MKRNRVIGMIIASFMILGLVCATAAVASDKAAQETIQGMVEKGEKGITMVKTDDGQIVTILNKNMAEMVGKKVRITGTLTKGSKNKSIIVTSFEEVAN